MSCLPAFLYCVSRFFSLHDQRLEVGVFKTAKLGNATTAFDDTYSCAITLSKHVPAHVP